MSPSAGDDVAASLHGTERRLSGLRRLGWPSDQLRSFAGQFCPPVVEFHVITDLHPEFAEVALEHRNRLSWSRTTLHSSPFQGNDQVHLAVSPSQLAFAPDQDCCVRTP